MSSVTAKPKTTTKPKPAEEERLRDAWVILPIVIAVHRDRDRGRYYAAHYESMREMDAQMRYDMQHRAPERTTRDYELYTIRMRVRPEAVTGVSEEEGPDGTIIFVSGVQYTCKMSARAVREMLL
jgi:hypothetical protein